MNLFNKTHNTGNDAPSSNGELSAKEQEQKDEAAQKAAKDAAAKVAKSPALDAHGNPMPDLNAPAREEAKAKAKAK